CKEGRVAFVDIAGMLDEVKGRTDALSKELRYRWQYSDVTLPIGPFRMRFVVARQRDTLDAVFESARPETRASFSYGLSEWWIETVAPVHGETAEQALAPG